MHIVQYINQMIISSLHLRYCHNVIYTQTLKYTHENNLSRFIVQYNNNAHAHKNMHLHTHTHILANGVRI